MTDNQSVDKVLENHSKTVRAVVDTLRSTVQAALPGYNERVQGTSISYGRKGAIVSIVPEKTYASVQFARGAHFSDPKRLLQGGAGDMRQVVVRDKATANSAAFKALVAQARQFDAK